MALSQNGYIALPADSPLLYTWTIPATSGDSRIRLRNGSAGFLLAVFALWFAETIQPITGRTLDDWGYAYRPVRGATVLSNHASGTAMDLNATEHALGRRGTFTPLLTARIRARLLFMRRALAWGGDYHNRADEMHFELNVPLGAAETQARRLMNTPRGKRVLAANPSQRAVILS